MRRFFHFAVLSLSLFLFSCEEAEETPSGEGEVTINDVPAEVTPAPKPTTQPVFWSELKLHEAIRSANPGYSGNGQFQIDESGQVRAIALDNCGVTDLSVFAGMPLMAIYLQGCPVPDVEALRGMALVELYLENTAVKDLSPLKGMKDLRKLYLSGTMVEDLSPLEGLGITELNLVNTPIKNLAGLKGMPLNMVWLTDTQVRDISPLASSPLVSLTLHRTPITDLSPLATTSLQRLHIGETDVTDLSPLGGLRLTRLVFDPEDIKEGVEAVKKIPTMQEIGTKFEDGANDLKPPAVFWAGPSEAPESGPARSPKLLGPRIENLPSSAKAEPKEAAEVPESGGE